MPCSHYHHGVSEADRVGARARRRGWQALVAELTNTHPRPARAVTVQDFRGLARRRLPRAVFDYADGGAEDEAAVRGNVAAFDTVALRPRMLAGVSEVDTSCTIAGQRVTLPLILSPTGFTRMFHPDGECAVARAAARAGIPYALSTMGTTSIEDVAAAGGPDCWFQVYVWRDRSLTTELIQRSRAAGYRALILTVDTTVAGQRERDMRHGMTIPPVLGLRTVLDGIRHPRWSWRYASSAELTFENVVGHGPDGREDATALGTLINSQFDPTIDWDDLAWMVEQWGGPFYVKGICRADDARRAADVGVTGVMVSNHGGRQLDHAVAPFDAVPSIRDATGGSIEVILDGGVRRGTDIVKAIARGATACSVGRPYVWALAAMGESGVDRVVDILASELRRAMQLSGCASIADLDASLLAGA